MATVEAQKLKAGMVVDYGPWMESGQPTNWQTPMVASDPIRFDEERVVIRFIDGPPPLRLVDDWPVVLDTPDLADFRAALAMQEAEMLLAGEGPEQGR